MADFIINCLADFPFYSLLALSFLISFRVMNFPDLAIDSSYALGMALLVFISSSGRIPLPLLLTLIVAPVFGFLIGSTTASLHGARFIQLSKLLAGLVVSFALFSVNFRINGGTTTNGLYSSRHEFNYLRDFFSGSSPYMYRLTVVGICLLFLFVVVTIVGLFLNSGIGACIRVAGHRPNMLFETGTKPLFYLIGGLGFANIVAVLAGCLRAATDNYADINTFGIFLYALASLLLGERILGIWKWGRRNRHMLRVQLLTPIVGGLLMSVLIQFCIWLLSSLLNVYLSGDIRLIIALVLVVAGSNPKNSTDRRDALNAF